MTTTPETPALPGDLTDETIERAMAAAAAVREKHAAREVALIGPGTDAREGGMICGGCGWQLVASLQWLEADGTGHEEHVKREAMRAALAAARVTPIQVFACPDTETYVTGCNDGYEEGLRAARDVIFDPAEDDEADSIRFSHAIELIDGLLKAGKPSESVAPVTPSESDWLLLLTPDSGAHRTREWRGRAVDADTAIERAMDENPGWSVHTFGPDVNAKPAPSPDREKRRALAKVIEGALAQCGISVTYAISGPGELFDVAGLVLERYPALAVPPVVNKAKLAEVFGEALPSDCAVTSWQALQLAAAARERQREWLGTER